ncbi:hypothetical protein NX02_06005 [Sphingomonas sanxanigenens DSM 19645 = NX02]|uniref:ABM domain-containing protein n=1 Tax=Sphingomonas sanxanigenens DSM 19645 = NX02 TaxID=1123269 RepID=W0A9B7_9SPHN|nr:hypothetical protein NX02_06005 [Sphingomonas sanxanigenens DSM 19645 = NX02]
MQSLLVGMAPHCRAEPGNLRWDIWQDPSHDGRYVIDELYVDIAGLEAHRTTPHYLDYLGRIPDLADRMAFIVGPVDVR